MSNQEKIAFNPEQRANPEQLKEAAEQAHERIKENLERRSERSPEHDVESARHEVEQVAHEQERRTAEHSSLETQERRRGPITKSDRNTSYKQTMNEIQTHMSPAGRSFSKLIHNPVVEKVSDAVGTTVARPNAVLSGAVFAFILTLGTYLVARYLGYRLSGFETIGAFALGWLIGIVYDFLKVMITGKKA